MQDEIYRLGLFQVIPVWQIPKVEGLQMTYEANTVTADVRIGTCLLRFKLVNKEWVKNGN